MAKEKSHENVASWAPRGQRTSRRSQCRAKQCKNLGDEKGLLTWQLSLWSQEHGGHEGVERKGGASTRKPPTPRSGGEGTSHSSQDGWNECLFVEREDRGSRVAEDR